MFLFFYRIEICVRSFRIENLVAIHYGHEVFRVRKIDDIVGIARNHDDRLDLVTADFIVQDLITPLFAHLDKAMTGNHYKLFPLGVVPMLAFGDARLGYVYAYLTAVKGVYKFGKRAAIIYVHLQVEDSLLLRKIT